MKLLEFQAKEVLASLGIAIPPGRVARTPDEAAAACESLGPVAVKAQVPVGGRGKAGGIKLASTPEEARRAAQQIIGMDIEQVASESPDSIARLYPNPWRGPLGFELNALVFRAGLAELGRPLMAVMKNLYRAIPELDAVTAEINPLVVTRSGDIVAGDAKLEIDDSAMWRQQDLDRRYGSTIEGDPYSAQRFSERGVPRRGGPSAAPAGP